MKPRQAHVLTLITLACIVFGAGTNAEPHAEASQSITNSVGMRFAVIPSGSFTMGSPDSENGRISNETQRTMTFAKPFYIGATEVTQKQWREVMGTDPSFFKGDDLPVEHITWHKAIEFCRRLSRREKNRYRLPTEAEWEYACRGGTTTAYHTGDGEEALADAGWFLKNGSNHTHPVGLKKPNAWGLYDMHGNVSEWCADRAEEEPDTYNTKSDLLNVEIAALRDYRGGSWGLNASDCRSASRHRNQGRFQYFDLGLRVVREVD